MNDQHARRRMATLAGGGAVLLWASLATLTAASGPPPPFLATAICFSIAGALAAVRWTVKRENPLRRLKLRPIVWLVGVGGLFGNGVTYMAALRNAPAIEASLVNYLWPLLIVVLSALLPGERLRARHIVGVVLGLGGTALAILGASGNSFSFEQQYVLGYALAFAAGLIWAVYSVLSRRFGDIPSDAVGGFCLVTAALAAVCHLAFEASYVPPLETWPLLVALGLGPIGAAFYLWDYGVKKGDIQALGAMSYAAPVLSTVLLVATGHGEATVMLGLACALVALGAIVAAPRPSSAP